MDIRWNRYQTPYELLNLENEPQEIQDQFWDFINNVPYIRSLISENRPRACDLPRDEEGKIIIDITKPHIIEDSDYFRPTAIHYKETGRFTDLRPNPNPNSEFGKWIREEIRRCYEGYVRPSDGEWITGDLYFFLNYCPILQDRKDEKGGRRANRVVDFPKFWEGHYYLSHYLNIARKNGHHAAELASRGKGKAIPNTEFVLTPDGYKLWGDINIGSRLYAPDGSITKVIDIPFDGMVNMLRITLADGRSILCSKEHLFKIFYRGQEKIVDADFIGRNYHKTRKTSAKNPTGDEYVISLPINGALPFDRQVLPIEPYTLGLILGDGCITIKNNKNVVRFTSLLSDVLEYKQLIPYNITTHKRDIEHSIHIPNAYNILNSLGLLGTNSHTKFIPEVYKYSSVEDRISLLQGLIDTDGWINGKTQCFCTASEQLKDDVLEVARSLGIKSFVFKKKNAWTLSFQTEYNLCRLTRKISKRAPLSNRYKVTSKRITITKVEYIGNYPAKCVTVDREDGMFVGPSFIVTHNSYLGASLLAKRFILGESREVNKKVQCVVTASEKKYLSGANQILDMFSGYIDFCAQNTQFPSKRLVNTMQNLQWTMGYQDLDSGTKKGTLNSVIGITSKDDESKLRGSRGVLYLIEEFGTFPRLLGLYNTLRPSVEDGENIYGLIFMYGTSGDNESDFASAQEIMYNPLGYNMQDLPNVYDKEGQGRKLFTFFFPGYMNRAECYDKDGNSDVTKALLEILKDRYLVKYNSTDINSITKRIAEIPITPQEAILKTRGNLFPVTDLNERLNQLDNNPREFDDVYTGTLIQNAKGEVEFCPTTDLPIRDFPLKDNKAEGALEIFNLPEKNREDRVFPDRYIIGHDPVDDDESDTLSLTSTFVLDLWTDQIVAEYTGRKTHADDNFEMVRKLCLFYNAKCLYENNKKGIFAYFSRMNCTYLLADTPEYLKDKDLIKVIGVGNKAHPYSQIVRTPSGVKLWGDIKIGDILFGSNGTTCKVIDIPFDAETDIYEIELKDGRKVKASENHLWNVIDYTGRERIVTTKFIKDNGFRRRGNYIESKFYIPQKGLVKYQFTPIDIDPYFLGLMIGDGCFVHSKHNQCYFTSTEEDFKEYSNIVKLSYKRRDNRHWVWEYRGFGKLLDKYGLANTKSHTKFIPPDYKYNTEDVRINLLRGLLDTDGHIDYGGNAAYVTVSEKLCEDVLEIARSLGITCTCQVLHNSYGEYFKILFYTDKRLFNLPRKYSRQKLTKTRAFKIGIKSVRYIGREQAKCVTVDSSDHCYLIGDFVLTHNSKGVNATAPINNYANTLIRDWLLKPITVVQEVDGEQVETTIFNLYRIRNRALLKELILFNPDINVDRVRALGMVMLYREEKVILYQGDMKRDDDKMSADYLGNDPFFKINYDDRLMKFSKK